LNNLLSMSIWRLHVSLLCSSRPRCAVVPVAHLRICVGVSSPPLVPVLKLAACPLSDPICPPISCVAWGLGCNRRVGLLWACISSNCATRSRSICSILDGVV
jgi:hypothetical protein